jgi:sugar lactone lactonase YvrE
MKQSLLAGFLSVGLFWLPVHARDFDAEGYKPQPRPKLQGVLQKNHALSRALIICKGKLHHPEDVAVDADGIIYAGSAQDGKVYRIVITPDGSQLIEPFADPGGGSTLGLLFDHTGNLIACNTLRGLISINKKGEVSVLTNHSDQEELTFPDDLDIDSSGKIYFSNASNKFNKISGMHSYVFDFLEGRAHGTLNVYDPVTKETKCLLKGLYFANGVALSPDEDFVLCCESSRYRVQRFWLKGPKAGTKDVFVDNLSGLPDGITRDPKGGYWIAIPALRTKYIDLVQGSAHLKNFAGNFPAELWRSTKHYGLVLHVNDAGEIVESLHDPKGRFYFITNVVPWKNYLYLGTLDGHSIARYKRPDGVR